MNRIRMPRPIPTFQGELVFLRQPIPEIDCDGYFKMNSDPCMHTWTGNHVLKSPADAKKELERFLGMDDISTWMIIDKKTNEVAGRFFLCIEDRDGGHVAGDGNRIAKKFWRKGHNKEARRILYSYLFQTLNADRLETAAWQGNTNSIRSIESYGFRFLREEIEWNAKHEKALPKRYYVLTRSQWEQISRKHIPK